MNLDEPFGMLVFFSIFEVLGGGALGIGLRGLLKRDFSGVFFLIWGGGFAGIPLVIGGAAFLAEGAPAFIVAQLFVFLTAVVTVALLPDDLLKGAQVQGAEAGAIFGALVCMVGGIVVALNLRYGIGIGLVIGGVIAFFGLFVLLRAALSIVRSL